MERKVFDKLQENPDTEKSEYNWFLFAYKISSGNKFCDNFLIFYNINNIFVLHHLAAIYLQDQNNSNCRSEQISLGTTG